MVIEVKITRGGGDSIETSLKQISEAWLENEGLPHWTYVAMIVTENINPVIDSDACLEFIIEGTYQTFENLLQ